MEPAVASVFESLRRRVSGVSALLVLDSEGEIVARASGLSEFDVARFASEYAMLLRIVRRSSEDAGTGVVTEHVAISDKTTVLARQLPSGHFAILIASSNEHLGRLRFETRQIEWSLDRAIKGSPVVPG